MAYILRVTNSDGTVSFRADVRIKHGGVVAYGAGVRVEAAT
jgi:hypothetical protein